MEVKCLLSIFLHFVIRQLEKKFWLEHIASLPVRITIFSPTLFLHYRSFTFW